MSHPFLILTGMSGSGKSAAMRAFEDMGYYCVDNLPLALISVFADLCARSRHDLPLVALAVDVREKRFVEEFPEALQSIRDKQPVSLLFFDADDKVLVRRFGETRRPHPMAGGNAGLWESIQEERRVLTRIRTLADRVVDTTAFSVHDLKAYVRDNFTEENRASTLLVLLQSFGYKHGAPTDMDLILDVRFIPNPFFVETLREQTGRDAAVVAFLEKQEEYRVFLEKILDLLQFLLPLYVQEGKSYLRIGIGCTGGRHRSVAVTEYLHKALANAQVRLNIQHRDLEKR